MKFTDGYWLIRDGVTAHFAKSVADIAVADDRITLYTPVREVRHRGDTLNSPLLTVECWSPAEASTRISIGSPQYGQEMSKGVSMGASPKQG